MSETLERPEGPPKSLTELGYAAQQLAARLDGLRELGDRTDVFPPAQAIALRMIEQMRQAGCKFEWPSFINPFFRQWVVGTMPHLKNSAAVAGWNPNGIQLAGTESGFMTVGIPFVAGDVHQAIAHEFTSSTESDKNV